LVAVAHLFARMSRFRDGAGWRGIDP
jgi:hypothetical protein